MRIPAQDLRKPGTTTMTIGPKGDNALPPVEQDRRAFPRFRVRGTACCRPSSKPFQLETSVRLVDISQDGIGMLVRESYQPGDRLQVYMEGIVSKTRMTREVEVRWRIDGTDGWHRIGCFWTHYLTYAELQKFI
jgi:hypothetical protein